MGEQDKRVDAYIAKSADFAKPILSHLRALVHQACPDVEESIKWSFPNFDYKGFFAAWLLLKSVARLAFGRLL